MQQITDRIIASVVPMNKKGALACFVALEKVCALYADVYSKRKDFSEDGTSGALHKAIESVNSEFRAEREIALCLIEGFRLTVEYSLIKRGMKDAPVGRSYLSDLEHRINECKITLRRHDNNAYASMLRLEKLFAEKEAFQELMHKKVTQIVRSAGASYSD